MMNKKYNLNNWTITGLMDAEGSFGVNLLKDDTRKLGYIISVYLELSLNYKDKFLLESIKEKFGLGNIYHNSSDNTYKWKVSDVNKISDIIIPYFTKYYLLTQKRADFYLFVEIIKIIKRKEHLTPEGLQKIINLKASLNLGLSDNLKTFFSNTVPVKRPKVSFNGIPDPNWLSGFAEGEACFFISIYRSPKSKLGLAIQLVFKLTQHSRDVDLLNGIKDFFGCGRVENRKEEACDFTVTSFKAIEGKIIPFFINYPLMGSKALNFEDFNKVVEIMKAKGHLTEEGLIKIKNIKVGMNTGRQ